MQHTLIPLLILTRQIFAQTTATSFDSSSLSNAGISPGAYISTTSTSSYPIQTIFLPVDNLGTLYASVVTAYQNQTAYAIGCLHPATSCAVSSSATITEGPSSLIYTVTEVDEQDSSRSPGTTINCALTGYPRASIAVCTGRSAISGLGNAASTSTLASSQIHYVPVTITAGANKLSAVPNRMGAGSGGSGSSSSSGGAISAATGGTGARWMKGVAMGFAVMGVL